MNVAPGDLVANTSERQVRTTATVVVIVNQAWAVWKFRTNLIRSIRDAGFRVVVLTSRDEAFDLLKPLCDELVDIPMQSSRVSVLADASLLLGYWRHLRRIRPAAVLTFGIKPNVYASIASETLGLPVINNITGLGSIQRKGGAIAVVVQLLYRIAFRRSRRVFFQNAEDMQQLLERSAVRRGQVALLPGSGVDIDHYLPTARSNIDAGVRFCMVARLLRDKGVVEFAEAAGAIKERFAQARFDLWGKLEEHDPRCVSRLQIADWERRGWLVFHGEARDAREAFSDADVAVLPSYYPEGTPRSLLEAASMGLPAITTDMPGCRNAVLHEVTGLLCAPRDVPGLAASMVRMIELGPAGRSELGRHARIRAVEEFDEDIVIRAYLSQLRSVHAP